jgi:hypothetical protein
VGPDDNPLTLVEQIADLLDRVQDDAASMGCAVSYLRRSMSDGFYVEFSVRWGDKDPSQMRRQLPGPDGPVVIRG